MGEEGAKSCVLLCIRESHTILANGIAFQRERVEEGKGGKVGKVGKGHSSKEEEAKACFE